MVFNSNFVLFVKLKLLFRITAPILGSNGFCFSVEGFFVAIYRVSQKKVLTECCWSPCAQAQSDPSSRHPLCLEFVFWSFLNKTRVALIVVSWHLGRELKAELTTLLILIHLCWEKFTDKGLKWCF